MQYMGSKRRIAKDILPIMLLEMNNHNINTWVEPFVGGANMIDKVPPTYTRIGSDVSYDTIQALIAIRDYVDELPDNISETQYKTIIQNKKHPIDYWVNFVCSFAGKGHNSGYARCKIGISYALQGKNNAIKQSPFLQNIHLINTSYENLNFTNCLIYCDPPI
jgi:DNA adenine methylase